MLFFVAILVAPLARAQSVELTVLSPPSPPPLAPPAPAVQAPPDLRPYEGRPIDSVDVDLVRGNFPDVEEPKVTSVKPGMIFTPRIARMALDDVLSSAAIGDARVSVEPSGAGVKLTIVAVPRVVIEGSKIEVHGADVDTEEMARDAQLQEGDELLAHELGRRQRRMEVFLARAGYPDAKLDIIVRETDKKNRILLVVDVQPGKPRLVQRRVFYAIEADKKDIEPLTADYAVKIGDRVQETQLEAADADLERRLRGAGWHEASVSHDVVLANNLVTVRVRIDAGPRYVASFIGNQRYDDPTLHAALGIDTETDFSQPHLVDKIKAFYRSRGYLDVEVALDVRPDPAGRKRFLVFHVIEHERVLVSERSYPCLKESEVSTLKGGGPTSAKAIGREIDSFLEEDLPGADLFVDPDPRVVRRTFDGDKQVTVPIPVDLNPSTVYAADSYERAIEHVQELYRNEGYLGALVGPVQVLRRKCGPGSLPGKCIPVDPPPDRAEICTYDPAHLPLPPPALDPSQTCVPDAAHHVMCEARVALRIPVKLGPRTMLYDVAFTGATHIEESRLVKGAELLLGDYVSQIKLEQARRKIVDLYKEEGFFYVDVKYTIEKSPDSTRARVRFDITEGERVIVRKIIIRGNRLTHDGVIRRRVALYEGQPYRTSDVQKTQERIATLGVFTSVSIALANPYVPTKDKNVIITVVERTPQYFEVRPGISSGEGIRGAVEYGHRNLFGSAIALTARVQVSYLPVLAFPDIYAQGNPALVDNFRTLEAHDNFPPIAVRSTVGLGFSEMGLGPLVRSQLDGVFYRDIQRDFRLMKGAAVAAIQWTPVKGVRLSFSPTAELNDVFAYATATSGSTYCDLVSQARYQFILRVPEGTSFVNSYRLLATWDRRDQSLSAHSGTYIAAGLEPAWSAAVNPSSTMGSDACKRALSPDGQFVRLTQTVAGYIPLTKKITLALQLRLGENLQLVPSRSSTYPDRLFYMGGFDSMRGWAQDTFIPQDLVDAIDAPDNQALADTDSRKLTAGRIPIRGGDLMVNPRVELRLPITGPFETVVFGDFGNLWRDIGYPFRHGFPIRVAVGSGVRVQTPVGPLALDYGINLTRLSYEDFGALSFSVGLF